MLQTPDGKLGRSAHAVTSLNESIEETHQSTLQMPCFTRSTTLCICQPRCRRTDRARENSRYVATISKASILNELCVHAASYDDELGYGSFFACLSCRDESNVYSRFEDILMSCKLSVAARTLWYLFCTMNNASNTK